MPPSASSSALPSNSSGNGSRVSSSTEIVTPGAASSIADATSASVTAGPPRWKTRASRRAARADAMKTRAVSGANCSCVRPPNEMR
jgi:hypothetical protein